MAKRKQYIIDKKFQLKTTLNVIGSIFLVLALLTALVLFNVITNNKEIAAIIEIEDNIVQVLGAPSPELSENKQKMSQEMAKHHDNNMKTLRDRRKTNTNLLWVILAIVFAQGVIFYFVMIRQTHRIAGPVYVMSQYMKEIIDGKIPKNIRKLREKDLLKDFYDLFSTMVKSIEKVKKKK